MAKGLSALSATAGTAVARRHRIVLNWVMIKIVPEQGRAVAVKPATANINLALAIRAINTPVPALATPVVQVLLAAANTPHAPAPAAMSGKTEAAR